MPTLSRLICPSLIAGEEGENWHNSWRKRHTELVFYHLVKLVKTWCKILTITGFFYIMNLGLSQAEVDQQFAIAKAFSPSQRRTNQVSCSTGGRKLQWLSNLRFAWNSTRTVWQRGVLQRFQVHPPDPAISARDIQAVLEIDGKVPPPHAWKCVPQLTSFFDCWLSTCNLMDKVQLTIRQGPASVAVTSNATQS